MLVKIVQDDQDSYSYDANEEHRILSELGRIDKKLRSKANSRGAHEEWRLWDQNRSDQPSYQKKDGLEKDKANLLPLNPHMDYFSEICSEGADDDSLFDSQNPLMVGPRHLQQPESSGNLHRGRKESWFGDNRQAHMLNTQSQKELSSASLIQREMNYVYRKEAQDLNQVLPKVGLPPRSSKTNGKNASNQQLRHQRQPSATLKTADNNKKPTVCKKQSPIEVQPEMREDPTQFRFHTFEAYKDKGNENETQEAVRKCSKYRQDEHDRISLECTFKPTILKKSAELAKSKQSVVQRLSQQPIKDQKKPYQVQNKPLVNKSRIEQLSQPRRLKTQGPQKVEQIPSFRPSLSKKSLEQMSNCIYDVATRNELWKKQKEEKLLRMREEEEREKERRQNCTYSPTLCHYKGDNTPNLSRFGKEGIENYFERVSSGMNKGKSRTRLSEMSKQNRGIAMNLSKDGYSSKGVRKQKYEQAVRQLHSRILGLKI